MGLARDRGRNAPLARSWWAAVAVAGLVLIAFAGPIAAAQGVTVLRDAVVTPRSGTVATTVVISVVYENRNGSRADAVVARIGAVDHAMTRDPGGDWGSGVTFRWTGTLPLGVQAVLLMGTARNHDEVSLAAGTIVIEALPIPTPLPTATATPRPTPTPTPRPSAIPTPTPRPTARPTPVPTPRATTTPTANATPTSGTPTGQPESTPAPIAGGISGPTTKPTGPGGPIDTPGSSPTADFPQPSDGPIAIVVGGSPGDPGSPGSTTTPAGIPVTPGTTGPGGSGNGHGVGAGGPVAALLTFTGFHGPTLPGFSLVPTLVTTTGTIATAMAFSLFGRRRRDDEDDEGDHALARAAASGVNVSPRDLGAGLPLVLDGPMVNGGYDIAGAGDLELQMPRWRRPSLIQARKTDPIHNVPAPRLTFDQGLVGPLDGRERRVIRYRVVRLLDSPDELRGAELGYLDRGDEVQLLEKYGAYWLVLAPDGQQGWLHKMTLGDAIDEVAPTADVPTATMPIAADSWTMAEDDSGGDAFESYLESRRRED